MALGIECECTDGAEISLAWQYQGNALRLGFAFLLQRTLQLLPALLGAKVGRIDQAESVLDGKGFGTISNHHHVPGLFHHSASKQDRILHPVHAGNGPGLV